MLVIGITRPVSPKKLLDYSCMTTGYSKSILLPVPLPTPSLLVSKVLPASLAMKVRGVSNYPTQLASCTYIATKLHLLLCGLEKLQLFGSKSPTIS